MLNALSFFMSFPFIITFSNIMTLIMIRYLDYNIKYVLPYNFIISLIVNLIFLNFTETSSSMLVSIQTIFIYLSEAFLTNLSFIFLSLCYYIYDNPQTVSVPRIKQKNTIITI